MEHSWAISSLLERVKEKELSNELLSMFNNGRTEKFIQVLSTIALVPYLTDDVLVLFQSELVEITANWLSSLDPFAVCIAFAKVLPYAPYLRARAFTFLDTVLGDGNFFNLLDKNSQSSLDLERKICCLLLAVLRLLRFEHATYRRFVLPSRIYELFLHPQNSVKYLAVQVLALYLHAADAATASITQNIVGTREILGIWEEIWIDYRFLYLWEETRSERLRERLCSVESMTSHNGLEERKPSISLEPLSFSGLTVDIYGVLLPRKRVVKKSSQQALLKAPTPTTVENCRKIALALLHSSLLILTGPIGSGKGFLLNHVAHQLQNPEELLTIHLNETSDVKSLIGFYSSESIETGLTWKSGVLTQAMKNGYWLIVDGIENVRAEALSLLTSVVQEGILFVPSTGETVTASPNFKVIGITRLEVSSKPNVIKFLRGEIWRTVFLSPLLKIEYSGIVSEAFPNMRMLANQIINIYFHLKSCESRENRQNDSKNYFERELRPKDMLKLCKRISASAHHEFVIAEDGLDGVFLDALDIFTASIVDYKLRMSIASIVAENLHIDPRRRDYLLKEREVGFVGAEPCKSLLSAGRISISKKRAASTHCPLKRNQEYALSRQNLILLEQILAAVKSSEPILIVGETGIGKTASIQYLAKVMNCELSVINLSQQTETADLVGGMKPIDIRQIVVSINNEFHELLQSVLPYRHNRRFYDLLSNSIAKSQWKRVLSIWKEALKSISVSTPKEISSELLLSHTSSSRKKRRIDDLTSASHEYKWQKFEAELDQLESRLMLDPNKQVFGFVEGLLVKAMKRGEWVLLDEINLASSETLECIGSLVRSTSESLSSLCLYENGSAIQFRAHPDFRLFAAMNPATEIGRTKLVSSLRSCFTELYFDSPDKNQGSLRYIVEKYVSNISLSQNFLSSVIGLYFKIKEMCSEGHLYTGIGSRPTYSLRTLTRVLIFVRDLSRCCSLRRAFYEGFVLGFSTPLQRSSSEKVENIIVSYIFGDEIKKSQELRKTTYPPDDAQDWINQEGFWLRRGSFQQLSSKQYIVTSHVQKNLTSLSRAISARYFPILIEGPTATGKTSMIDYLASVTCHKIIRINNHEHTDIQEYLGRYVQAEDGKISFEEGHLIQALRFGYWIILDELNLAPSEVLEALNRLLDDNRELLIPETQEIVKPHPHFVLFATQNPAGKYGGRKTLSSPFRNRFIELYFDDIPLEELVTILFQRTNIPKSWCERIAAVYRDLGKLRDEDHIFDHSSVATLRDLFRWASRKAETIGELADNGYMLLAERARKPAERNHIKSIIERIFSDHGPRISIDHVTMYHKQFSSHSYYSDCSAQILSQGQVVWTAAMKRLYILIWKAIQNNEPVLLVGETGSGKTTMCQTLAKICGKTLFTLNAHQNTESSDLIGSQRPLRNKESIIRKLNRGASEILQLIHRKADDLNEASTVIDNLSEEDLKTIPQELMDSFNIERLKLKKLFGWMDGSLVQAMKQGQFFLLDEISLADDSVLERLNSVLEPDGKLLLAEKGKEDALVACSSGFQFFATMNPGGDYGKRELSPALRNRFTEIWVPSTADPGDLLQIAQSMLQKKDALVASCMVDFAYWFNERYCLTRTHSLSIRDIATWATFINNTCLEVMALPLVHGAALVFIDSVGAQPGTGPQTMRGNISMERQICLKKLSALLNREVPAIYDTQFSIAISPSTLSIGLFSVERKIDTPIEELTKEFSLQAPTARHNAMRIVRALQIDKPILLEGDPGVGKTALISALASLTGNSLVRINLSEQTDITDLLGSESPTEGEEIGSFDWKDAPVLKAMKFGHWVLLDEINLASQSILEGLNSCIDHRGECYVPELDRTFPRHSQFRLFATQNPHSQGYGRKGLPQAFINRFTVVYIDSYTANDHFMICKELFPTFSERDLTRMIKFSLEVGQLISRKGFPGIEGGPWDFNLRDILRWISLLSFKDGARNRDLGHYLKPLFLDRFHDKSVVDDVLNIFKMVFPELSPKVSHTINISKTSLQIGLACFPRDPLADPSTRLDYSLEEWQDLSLYESMLLAVEMAWPVLLVGLPGSGKYTMIHSIASITGMKVVTIPLNYDVDLSDLIGGLEQVNYHRDIRLLLSQLFERLRHCCVEQLLTRWGAQFSARYLNALRYVDLIHVDIDRINHGHLGDILEEACAFFADTNLDKVFHSYLKTSSLGNPSKGVRFQWVDGPLIRALEEGNWVVLSNASTCNSSVLDRLNSLLEKDRSFNLNENCCKDGSPRVIKPHPNFRIFMTSCPDDGNLSRAIKNRSVELYIPKARKITENSSSRYERRISLTQSSSFRFRKLKKLCRAYTNDLLRESCISYGIAQLSYDDLLLLKSFRNQLSVGLLGVLDQRKIVNILSEIDKNEYFYRHWDWKHINKRIFEDDSKSSEGEEITKHKDELQVFHPRENIDLAVLCRKDTKKAHLYGSLHDVWVDSIELSKLLRSLKVDEYGTEVRDWVSDATNGPFISRTKEILQILLHHVWERMRHVFNGFGLHTGYVEYLRDILDLCFNIYNSVTSTHLDEPSLRAIVMFLEERLSDMVFLGYADNLCCRNLLEQIDTTTNLPKLRTGQSMQRMWDHFHGPTFINSQQIQFASELEVLSEQFDDLKWKQRSSKIGELIGIQDSLIAALAFLKRSNDGFAASTVNINREILKLEHSSNIWPDIKPYFATDFKKVLSKLRYAHTESVIRPRQFSSLLQLLGDYTFRNISIYEAYVTSSPLRNVFSYFIGHECVLETLLDSRWLIRLLSKIVNLRDMPMESCEWIQEEMKALSYSMISLPLISEADQNSKLLASLKSILCSILVLHQDFFEKVSFKGFIGVENLSQIEEGLWCFRFRKDVQKGHYFQHVCQKFLCHSVDFFAGKPERNERMLISLGKAWAYLGAACLLLFTPNVSIDPALLPMLKKRFHIGTKVRYEQKLKDILQVEQEIYHVNDSEHRQSVRSIIGSIGSEPDAGQVYRAENDELKSLKSIYDLILQILNRFEQHCTPMSNRHGDPMLLDGIQAIGKRLSTLSNIYQDVKSLLTAFLHCLSLGCNLISYISSRKDDSKRIGTIIQHIPLLASSPKMWHADNELSQAFDNQSSQELVIIALKSLTLRMNAFKPAKYPAWIRECFVKLYDQSYYHWKKLVTNEQQQNKQKNGINGRYHYKSEETDNGQSASDGGKFNMDANDLDTIKRQEFVKKSSEELTIKLADIHHTMFMERSTLGLSLTSLVHEALNTIIHIYRHEDLGNVIGHCEELRILALLSMHSTGRSNFFSASLAPNYDFYADSNINEVLRFREIVKKIQTFASKVENKRGEDSDISAIVESCQQTLTASMESSLSILLRKSEQLYFVLEEKQKSHLKGLEEFTLDLANIIFSWRKLEAASWKVVLQSEEAKLGLRAKAWWFLLYEHIIIGTSEAAINGCLGDFLMKLLAIIEDFLLSSSLGQFSQRLVILKAYSEHLLQLAVKDDAFSKAHEKISTLIDYFSRHEPNIEESINTFRKKLSEDVNEIIQITALKNRNVSILKESALNSRKKINELVKKYREYLEQPASSLFLHSVSLVKPEHTSLDLPEVHLRRSIEYLHVCETTLSEWQQRKLPYKDVTSTVRTMRLLLNMNNVIARSTNRITNMRLSEDALIHEIDVAARRTESLETAKQQKGRKRQLFTAIKRNLRDLGFGRRLKADVLQLHMSPLNILTNLPPMSIPAFGNEPLARERFYAALQEIPNVRNITFKHTPNLPHHEVTRFVEHIESLLDFTMNQRKGLLTALASFLEVEATLSKLQSVIVGDDLMTQAPGSSIASFYLLRATLKLLPALISLTVGIMRTQNHFSDCKVEDLESSMMSWQTNFQSAYEKIYTLPTYVCGLVSEKTKKVYHDIEAMLTHFVKDLERWRESYPMLGNIIDRIIPWAKVYSETDSQMNELEISDADSMTQSFFELLDSMLGSIQDVQSLIATYDISLEAHAWFRSADKMASEILNAFNIGIIKQRLVRIVGYGSTANQDEPNYVASVNGLLKNLGPIIEQYRQIIVFYISQYVDLHTSVCQYNYFIITFFTRICSDDFWESNEDSAKDLAPKETNDDKIGLGDGEMKENATDTTNDSNDTNSLDHLKDQHNPTNSIAEEDTEELSEAGNLSDISGDTIQGKSVEGDADDPIQDLEEQLEQAGPSAVDEKMWDTRDTKGNDHTESGQGLAPGALAAEESSERIGETQNNKDRRGPEQEASTELASAGAAERKAEEENVLDDQEGADVSREQDDSKSPADQADSISDEYLDESFANYPNNQSSSPKSVEESSNMRSPLGSSDNLSEICGNVDSEEYDEKDVLGGEVRSQQEEMSDVSPGDRENKREQIGENSLIEPNFNSVKDDSQEDTKQKSRGTEGIFNERGKDSSPFGEYDEHSRNRGDIVDISSSHNSNDPNFNIWKTIGFELAEWMRRRFNARRNHSAENQYHGVDVGEIPVEDDHDLPEVTNPLKAEKIASLNPAREEEQQEQTSSTRIDREYPFDAENVISKQEEPLGDSIVSNQKNMHNHSKCVSNSADPEVEDPMPLDEPDINDIDRSVSLMQMIYPDSSQLDQCKDGSQVEIDNNIFQSLAQSLAEQLRLVLEPTKSTKFRGDFRTGKRLNIRRIVPYIASDGKRDKIWMRRSVPTRRAYQIMLAMDDSRSMVESNSVSPALQSLVLIAKALRLVEAGDLCIIAFGEECRVALDFGAPFSPEEQNLLKKSFTFRQSRTDVRALLEATLSHFRKARAAASSSESDLWQLQLIISDGICEEHAAIQKLLFQAEQERIMIVFIIMDYGAQASQLNEDASQQSILDLQTVNFASDAEGNMVVRRQHYMETFPFKWYLLLRNVEELPFVLATALRQWFAEVASHSM